ncbi:MAG: hypothetical protein ACRBI6_11665 [Acidimicrobiales bacterium]
MAGELDDRTTDATVEDPKAAARAAALAAAKEQQHLQMIAAGHEASRQLVVGWAMVAALVIGSPALADAVYGRGPIESALGRFAACLAACLFAGNLIANQLEKAPDPEPEDDESKGEDGTETDPTANRPVDLAGAADTR